MTEETPTDIKDNFVLAINKNKILATEIPEGYPFGGTTMDTIIKAEKDLRDLFRGDIPDYHDAKLAFELYNRLRRHCSFDAAALLLCPCRHTYSVWRQIKFPVLKYDLIPGNREHRTKFGIR